VRTLTALLIAIFSYAFAPGVAHAQAPQAWYGSLTIKYVYAGYAGGRVAVSVTTPINIGTCQLQEFVVDPNNPFFKQMMMLIMTAYMMGKPVNLYTDGTCFGPGVRLMDVWLPS